MSWLAASDTKSDLLAVAGAAVDASSSWLSKRVEQLEGRLNDVCHQLAELLLKLQESSDEDTGEESSSEWQGDEPDDCIVADDEDVPE